MSALSPARASHLLKGITGCRLLVLGDLMLDEYLFGEVHRISPEAPVPVVRVHSESWRLGGAGNVAANAAALGAHPTLVGVLGEDRAGERFRDELARSDLETGSVLSVAGRRTTVKTRVIAHGQQVVRCDREDLEDVASEVEQRVVAAFLERLPSSHAVAVSDYAKGLLTRRVLKEALSAAHERGLPVVVDPKVRNFSLYEPVTALTPNHHEAVQAAQLYAHDEAAIVLAGRRLLERLDARVVLITRGEAGMTLVERSGPVTHIPTVAREVFDVTGAGDTVTAVFTLALAAGGSFGEAAMLANHAAGVVVAKVGTAATSGDEILASL